MQSKAKKIYRKNINIQSNKKGVSQKFFICQTALKLLKKICQSSPIESDVTILRIQLNNKQTESMTEKFFKEPFWLLLWLWTKVPRRRQKTAI